MDGEEKKATVVYAIGKCRSESDRSRNLVTTGHLLITGQRLGIVNNGLADWCG